jgi:hypothetical protein
MCKFFVKKYAKKGGKVFYNIKIGPVDAQKSEQERRWTVPAREKERRKKVG